MTPKRIQRKRTKGWKMPEGAIYVGRPTKWGNPFAVEAGYSLWFVYDENRDSWQFETEEAARKFAVEMFEHHLDMSLPITEELRGKDLACWCKEGEPCHADVLLEIANS